MRENMRNQKIALILLSILLISSISVQGVPKLSLRNIQDDVQENGWLEIVNGVKILHLSGTNYEMGYQHGSLLKEETQQNLRAFLDYSDVEYDTLIYTWNIMKEYIPQEYIEEYQGIADGAGIPFDDIVVGYMTIVWSDMACFGISAWGSATKDGRLYHTRSLDYNIGIKDPISGKLAHENSVLIIRNPDNGFASISPSVAGTMHFGGGFNEEGIGIGMQVCWSKDYTLHGIPAKIRTQMVLDHASSAQEAIDILTNNRTLGWNFVISDAKIPIGYAVETSANYSYVGTFDNSVESNEPFWGIENVVRRTNFFIGKELASYQREHYDTSSFMSMIRLILNIDPFFAIWKSYQVMSESIQKNLGDMDLNSTMAMFRTVYSGRTNLLFYIIKTLAFGTSFTRSWNIWVADPLSGEMAVCFSSKNKIAYENPIHHFNLYSLLNSHPP
jgi:hypothetical protein